MFLALAIPVLTSQCLTCHNADAKTAGLDLTSATTLVRGGNSGPAIIPGDPDRSRLYQYVRDRKMPPGKPLDAASIEAIRQWIAAGASYEGATLKPATRPRAGLDWWSLQKPVRPAVPQVAGATHPIDAFLLAKLRDKGLDFAREATPRELERRLHFTLTGLPPQRDQRGLPFDAAVTRLLASPRYGERWARHWLDVARFGESDGGEHNHERMSAWKYRDYVINALNADKPYTDFVRDQIAGDLADEKLVAATGFLVAGPWDSVTKQINRDEMMRKTLRQDELDDFVTAAFATFQGLTVNCARCHDHKFDPIPQRDYYRLTAVFRGITYGERNLFTPEQKAQRDQLATPIRKELDGVRKQIAAIEDPVRTRLLSARYQAAAATRTGKFLPVNPIFNRNQFPSVTAREFRMRISAVHAKGEPRIDWLTLHGPGGPVHQATSWKAPKFASDDEPVAFEITLNAAAEVTAITWSADSRTGARDGSPRVYRLEARDAAGQWRTVASSLDHDVPTEFELPSVAAADLTAALDPADRTRRDQLAGEAPGIEKRLNAIPLLETVHAALLEPQMTPAHVLERGSIARPGEEVAAGALSAIRTLNGDFGNGDDRSRRLALAAWLTHRDNPLTARVIVNRVWTYHFGTGIVNTPSDFGFNGDRPSHPELLDWLATEFMDNGWSLKWLHRTILSSRAWKQSSTRNEKAFAIDAANRLYWRMSPKRLDAETLRDSILWASGNLRLDQTGGPSFLLQQKASRGSYLYLALDNDGPEVWRRGLYKFAARGGERVFMDSFDCPDPAVATPQRSVSNTPVQALTLLNNKFVLRQAELLAERIDRESSRDPVTAAFDLLFGRQPTAAESRLAANFVPKHGLAAFLRALFNSNEFLYVP